MKRLISLTLALVLTLTLAVTLAVPASAKQLVQLESAPQIFKMVSQGYNYGHYGPISITKGRYNGAPVYLVCVSGTENENPTVSNASISLNGSFSNRDNLYLNRVKNIMLKKIPEGSRVILAGHSLGGSIVEQLSARKDIRKAYKIQYTIAFGAPFVNPDDKREGKLNILLDQSDIVPIQALTTFTRAEETAAVTHMEDGGYSLLETTDCHMKSYLSHKTWGKYDVRGVKNGGAKLMVDYDTQRFYTAPLLSADNLK